MTIKKCNVCGKEFNMWDEQEDFGLHYHCGYGSKFDECLIDLDMCCNCFDKIMDDVISQCKINPIKELS